MYMSAADEGSTTLVGIYQGRAQHDADYERCIQSIIDADALATARASRFVCLLIIGDEVQRPPPLWRRRMADANNAIRAKEYYFALVSPSMLIRGVFTAINWLTKPRPGYHSAPFEHFDQAAEWIRTQTGERYPRLESLEATARAALRAAGQSSPGTTRSSV
jgi:hypothetical protein